ncbi:MAG TPA: DNA topology modulation protein [Clostridiaceae bacterium]
MSKIAVIGCGGAGKSTFSRSLGKILNIPVYHLDKLNWKPGWVPTPKDEWDELVGNLVSKEEWIIDGNYGRTLDIRLENADMIIFLNLPMYLCIYRIVKRRLMYQGKSRPDMNEGCLEKLDIDFIRWVWGYNKNQKPKILDKLKKYSDEKNVIILNNLPEVDKFIDDLKNNRYNQKED